MLDPPVAAATMGCGMSRINLMEDGMACGLKRRIVQVRSRNDLLAAHNDPSTASTKKLLKDQNTTHVGDVGDHLAVSHSQKHRVAGKNVSDDRIIVAPIPIVKEPPVQQQIREKEYSSTADHDQRSEKNCSPRLSKINVGSNERTYESDDDEYDDDGRMISDYDGAMLIGSPSFRMYCVDDSESEDSVNRDHGDDCSHGNKLVENIMQGMELACADEVSVQQEAKSLEKKESRGHKFRKVFPMHKTKHLWNVTACYSTRNNHHVPSDKLPEKVV